MLKIIFFFIWPFSVKVFFDLVEIHKISSWKILCIFSDLVNFKSWKNICYISIYCVFPSNVSRPNDGLTRLVSTISALFSPSNNPSWRWLTTSGRGASDKYKGVFEKSSSMKEPAPRWVINIFCSSYVSDKKIKRYNRQLIWNKNDKKWKRM